MKPNLIGKSIYWLLFLCLLSSMVGVLPNSPARAASINGISANSNANPARMTVTKQNQKTTNAAEDAGPPPVHLWTDSFNDLWVETPFFRWNITSGSGITAISASSEYQWDATSQTNGGRLIDMLFSPETIDSPTTTRIFYELPDEASIYLERQTSSGLQGLELSFIANSGLIRITHRSQDQNTTGFLPTQQSILQSSSAQMNTHTGQFPAEIGTASTGWTYTSSFDPTAQNGQAFFKPMSVQALQPVESNCYPNYPSREPAVHDPCQFPNFFLPGQVLGTEYLLLFSADPSAPFDPVEQTLSALTLTSPDLDVANIERTPRYNFDAAKNNPVVGDVVTFKARVANRGGSSTGVFAYTWYIDGVAVQSNTHASLAPGQLILLSINWTWKSGIHTVRLDLDPSNLITEVSEQNNSLQDRTNALSVGFWVEQSVYDYFNLHQVELGLGSVSWDDWAQRQISVWNQMMATAVHPLTPKGIIDRVRLDKITVVPDGTLPQPYPGNYPSNDKTVDMMWGFEAGLVSWYKQNPSVQNIEPSLLHEMSHARYLLDLYGFDIGFGIEYLSADISTSTKTVPVVNNVATNVYWPVPAYLAIDGELLICQSKSGNTFTNCSRGAEGTTAKSHLASAIVNSAALRLQDGQGNLILNSPAMPLIGGWNEHVYYNRYPNDLMSGGMPLEYDNYSAYAWNRIAGKRPVCGNQNAPCNIGIYANDLPSHHVIEIDDSSGKPLPGTRVELFQSKPNDGWYGKLFLRTADATYYTNSLGQVDIGAFPYGTGSKIIHTYGHSNADLLFRISSGGRSIYRFYEVSEANEAYWSGNKTTAKFIFNTSISCCGHSNGPWPMYRQNLQHTGRSASIGPANPNILWSFDTGTFDGSAPAIGLDKTIYVGLSNKLIALTPAGVIKWSYTAGGNIHGPSLAANGTIYAGAADGKLYALNPNGTLKWTYTTGNWISASPTIAPDGTIYIGSADGIFYAIGPDGVLKWTYTIGSWQNPSPAIGMDDTIYQGSTTYNVYALTPDGALKWQYHTGCYVDATPTLGRDGTLYISSCDNFFYALNPDGSLKWKFPTAGILSSATLGVDGTLYAGSDDNYLYAINPNGTMKWRYLTGDRVADPSLDGSGIIYAGSRDGYLYAINPTGTLKWRIYLGGWLIGNPVIGPDQTIYMNVDGRLYAILAAQERIKNGGFNIYSGTSKVPTNWTGSSTFLVSDGKDAIIRKEGLASVKITGNKTIKTLKQAVITSGGIGNTITFSYYVKASAMPTTGLCQAQVLFFNGTTLKSTSTLKCPAGSTYTWKLAKLNITSPVAYTNLVIKFTYSKSGGMVWFDQVSLVK